MKFRFKVQAFQTEAVAAVADCFEGQPLGSGPRYRIDPGLTQTGQTARLEMNEGFRNADLALPLSTVLKNIQAIQVRQNLSVSEALKRTAVCDVNLDIEMETGTGKTYCYIKTFFELHRRYGWSKFIVVVPSIAIREGVFQSLTDTSEHFLEKYGKKVRPFIYNSKELHNLESFSSDAGINVMVINAQAFNARGKDARRIYEELDDFQSRRPIDVIAANRPILILDEPQKMEGTKTVESLKEFKPLFILRYSATHKQEHNKIYRLDALDAYNQKLVKKIAVRGISLKGQAGTSGYLYLQSIEVSKDKAPVARVELEIPRSGGIKPEMRLLGKGDNLYEKHGKLDQYKGYVVADINALDNTLSFTNGVVLTAGDAMGDVNESVLRRLQIREAVNAHFEKEQLLFARGIKVLSLFFIDEVAKYRIYEGSEEKQGEYAQLFEEEYNARLNEILTLEDSAYNQYLRGIATARTHEGYFSIDKKSKRLVNPETAARSSESDDVDAYDLILKNKKRLLQFDEPVRFLFSHSALREGWDNPNVFVIGMLKHSDNTVSRRQEVGRGLRLSVNQHGDRMDDPATVHDVNVLTVVASESYKDFVAGLQKDIAAALSARPQKADEAYFAGKVLKTVAGDIAVTPQMAKVLTRYLIKHDYTDNDDKITAAYHEAKQAGTIAPLPPELAAYSDHIFRLVDSVYSTEQLPEIENGRAPKDNPLNANYHKKAFRELWSRIHRKAVYSVHFETAELIAKCVTTLDAELKVAPLQYVVERGEQTTETTYEALQAGEAFRLGQTQSARLNASVHSAVPYDLIGKLAEETTLTRATIGTILRKIKPAVFELYRLNPEDFLRVAARLVNEQKATVIVEHLAYSATDETYGINIFTQQPKQDLSKGIKANRHIYDYVFTDSQTERDFLEKLDAGTDIEVYAKLPKSFSIPTPVGDYTPDWAIAFKQGSVKHIYFIAETKGSMSSMEMREIEKSKIKCATKFFTRITSDQVKYAMVDSYSKLMELVH
ncbi:MAG: DEAD/DEAH box helicase family protein [Terracidiphilus sp.]